MDDLAIEKIAQRTAEIVLDRLAKENAILSATEVCKLFQIAPKTLYNLMQAGKFPSPIIESPRRWAMSQFHKMGRA